ncbi:AAA family ATPase [Streptomyces sp. SID4944]|nr:AAA family ATPase [Streptomyces sp. SID4944]
MTIITLGITRPIRHLMLRTIVKIKRARIENFCCLHNVDVSFEEITSFIGPTGVGKSTVLRALDWFFNGERSLSLSDDDVHSAAKGVALSSRWSSMGSLPTTGRSSGATHLTRPRA